MIRVTIGFTSLFFHQCVCLLNVFLHLIMEDAVGLEVLQGLQVAARQLGCLLSNEGRC